jgi:hypothetical protein
VDESLYIFYMKTSEEIDEIIDNPYKFTKKELRENIEELKIKIANKNINDRNLLEYKLDTLLSILNQY